MWPFRKRTETRDRDASTSDILRDVYGFTRGRGATGAPESLGAVLACVELISGALASLPASLTLDGPNGREPAPSNRPEWAILKRPNRLQSWPAFMQWTAAQLLLHGNAASIIQSDPRGTVTALAPVPWPALLPQVVGAGAAARLVYDLTTSTPESVLLGLPRRALDGEVLHIRNRSDSGIVGRSVLARAAGPAREAAEIERLAHDIWTRGLRATGVIGIEGTLTDPARARLRERLKEFKDSNDANVLILDQSAKFSSMAVSSTDQEFLNSRMFSVADIARLFRVPEPLLQHGQRAVADLAPFVTALAQLCLAPMVATIEAEVSHSVLPDGMRLAIDLDGLARGSFSAVVAALAALKQSAVITANDARAELGWGPIEGGDVLQAGTSPNWPADGPGSTHLGPSPGHTGDGPPEPGNHGNKGRMNGHAAGHA